jgi:hypothetical protein
MNGIMTAPINPTTDLAYLEERDNRLAMLFQSQERVWIVEQTYNPQTTQWHIDLVRMGKHGRWMRQRYLYEVPSKVIYFRGEHALSEAEFVQVRRTATLFHKHQAHYSANN